MAIPPLLLGAIGTAASNPKVQRAAERLMRDAYSRFATRRTDDSAEVAVDPVLQALQALQGLATKDELAAQFALLQAEIEDQERKIMRLVGLVILLQIGIIIGAFVR